MTATNNKKPRDIDEDLSNSEESDDDARFQPPRVSKKEDSGYDPHFFDDINVDVMETFEKMRKKNLKSKFGDKIRKIRDSRPVKPIEEIKSVAEDDAKTEKGIILSDDELRPDIIRVKDTKKNKKKIEQLQKLPNEPQLTIQDENATIDTDRSCFRMMHLSPPLLKAITKMEWDEPTPIQAATIPEALMGRDICGCAATGTGKTGAYMLPTLERLIYRPYGPSVTRVLVLVPTRELGVQVYQVSKQMSEFTNIQIGLAVGGLDVKSQGAVLRKRPDIVIATPGRLIDHLKSTPSFDLQEIEILILDEADRILDEFFAEQIKEIIKQCARTRQTMLFSATMTDEVKDLAAVSLNNPRKITVDSNKDVALNLRQEFVRIRTNREPDREIFLVALVRRIFRQHCIVFVPTKKLAHRLRILLGLLGAKAGELHGNLSQPKRLEALNKFKDGQIDVLVATDVAARGLDIQDVKAVINFSMPATLEHYIHRVGRTARAGRAGVSVSLTGEKDRHTVKQIEKRARNPVKWRTIPSDLLEKYRQKIEELEPEITKIMDEEHEEKMLNKAENQLSKTQKLIENSKSKGMVEPERPWFQTKQERRAEKERLSQKVGSAGTKNDNSTKNKAGSRDRACNNKRNRRRRSQVPMEGPEALEHQRLMKMQKLHARWAKKQTRPKRMYTVVEDDPAPTKKYIKEQRRKARKRKRCPFSDDDLFDVSAKNAKRLRYEGSTQKKMNTVDRKQGGKKKNDAKGKAFGRPQQKKKR